jgi:hypothetical protein
LLGAYLALALAASGCEAILGIKDRAVGDGSVLGLDASSTSVDIAGTGGNIGSGGSLGSDGGTDVVDAPGAGGGIGTGGTTGVGGIATGGVMGTGGKGTGGAGSGGVMATGGARTLDAASEDTAGTGGKGTGGVTATGGVGTGGITSGGGSSSPGGRTGTGGQGGMGGTCAEPSVSCNGDLSNVGTGDFTIMFTLTTSMTTHLVEILAQRDFCGHQFFWDAQLSAGALKVELDDNQQNYTECLGTKVINDGQPHRVVMHRAAGILTIQVDCALDATCTAATNFSTALPSLRRTSPCIGNPDPPVDLVGTLSNVCVASGNGGTVDGGADAGDASTDSTTVSDTPIDPDGGTPPGCSGAFVFDDFSGTALDTAKWWTNTSVPQGNASVVQTGGHVEISNRGYLNTIGEFVPAAGGVRVTGKWTFDAVGAVGDLLQVLTRTNGIPQGDFGEAQAGMECVANQESSTVMVEAWGTTVSNATSSGFFPLNQGDTLVFEMTDDGSLVTCAFVNLTSGNRATASATSTFAPTTNRITFHNREFDETRRALVDDLAIESGFANRPAHDYLFEEASGATAYDLSGTVNGTLATGASRVAAIRGRGVSFAATSDGYVDLGTVGSSLGTADFTIAFWFNVPRRSHLMDLLGNRVDGNNGNFVQTRMRGDGSVELELDEDVSGTNHQGIVSGPGYDDSKWHHLAVRRHGLTAAMYIDGALVTADTRTTGTPTDLSSGAPLRLGSSAIAATYDLLTTGTFDDVRVYNSALRDCDIALIGTHP